MDSFSALPAFPLRASAFPSSAVAAAAGVVDLDPAAALPSQQLFGRDALGLGLGLEDPVARHALELALAQHVEVGLLLAARGASEEIFLDVGIELVDADVGHLAVVAVGPEGGWTDFERRSLLDAGFVEVALGRRTFATDVACVALVAAVRERTSSW